MPSSEKSTGVIVLNAAKLSITFSVDKIDQDFFLQHLPLKYVPVYFHPRLVELQKYHRQQMHYPDNNILQDKQALYSQEKQFPEHLSAVLKNSLLPRDNSTLPGGSLYFVILYNGFGIYLKSEGVSI